MKRECKYCGLVHNCCAFTNCHNPDDELPDSFQDGYQRVFGTDEDDD